MHVFQTCVLKEKVFTPGSLVDNEALYPQGAINGKENHWLHQAASASW